MKRPFDPLASSPPPEGAIGRSWRSAVSFVLADFLFGINVITIFGAYWLDRTFLWSTLFQMGGIVVAGQVLAFTYFSSRRTPVSLLVGQIALGNVLAGLIYLAGRKWLHGAVSPGTFADFLVVFAPLQVVLYLVRRRWGATALLEPVRWMLLVVCLLWLHRPLLTTGSVGAGDAYWYSIMVADFVTQWREGIFPVFAGQTEFAFNGAISPLRIAPALQHLAGMVDLATLRSLPFYGILNLTLLGCLVGAAATCYGCLRAIEPGASWIALVLSLLYASCPAVLALVYTGDLFMSITALPWLPLLLYGAWRTLVKGDRTGMMVMVAAAAALWFCHPPIALWGTIVAAVTQVIRLAREGRTLELWRQWAIGAASFTALSLYCFVSVETMGLPTYPVYRPVLIQNLQSAFPASLHPVSKALIELGDYQLGWALWAALATGSLGLLLLRPRRPALAFLAAALVLLAFLIPVPGLLDRLWMAVPQAVCDITFIWPMQRLYVVLASLSAFLAFTTLGPLAARHRLGGVLLFAFFLGAGAWSTSQAAKFQAHAYRSTTPSLLAHRMLLPQNHILTRYSFNPFRSLPTYFSHNFIDPRMQNRLLAPGTFQELASNQTVVENAADFGVVRAEGTFATTRPDRAAPSLALSPQLRLEPHRQYVLKFDFAHPEFSGSLTLRGQRLTRIYYLPDSAYDVKVVNPVRAFGALPQRMRSITLWTDGEEAEDISLMFYFNDAGPGTETKSFGHYVLKEYDPTLLPVQVEQWAPYRARVNAPSGAFLETPRLFLAGYRALVNGQEAKVARSPEALVMVPLQPGANIVELRYEGPKLLRFAYYFSLASWAVLLVLALRAVGWGRSTAAAA